MPLKHWNRICNRNLCRCQCERNPLHLQLLFSGGN